jgi:hypothetical protein
MARVPKRTKDLDALLKAAINAAREVKLATGYAAEATEGTTDTRFFMADLCAKKAILELESVARFIHAEPVRTRRAPKPFISDAEIAKIPQLTRRKK